MIKKLNCPDGHKSVLEDLELLRSILGARIGVFAATDFAKVPDALAPFKLFNEPEFKRCIENSPLPLISIPEPLLNFLSQTYFCNGLNSGCPEAVTPRFSRNRISGVVIRCEECPRHRRHQKRRFGTSPAVPAVLDATGGKVLST